MRPDDPAQNFHIYIRWYLDGKLVGEKQNNHARQTLYLLFDTEGMGPWFAPPDKAILPSTYEVDFCLRLTEAGEWEEVQV